MYHLFSKGKVFNPTDYLLFFDIFQLYTIPLGEEIMHSSTLLESIAAFK